MAASNIRRMLLGIIGNPRSVALRLPTTGGKRRATDRGLPTMASSPNARHSEVHENQAYGFFGTETSCRGRSWDVKEPLLVLSRSKDLSSTYKLEFQVVTVTFRNWNSDLF